jgi:hypothetical protein
MEELIVEQHREYYPMTFYPECLTEILDRFKKPQLNNNHTFCLEPISICIPKIHYYGQLKLIQFYLGSITVIIFVFSITVSLLFSYTVGIFIFLFNILFFISYLIVQIYEQNLKKDLRQIEQKITSRKYFIKQLKNNTNNSKSNTVFLLNTLDKRDSIYDFNINDDAEKGFSEAYFLSYLNKWFPYPWRIIEHCQFEDEQGYTPTADFILINDDLKLAVDLEIDEPYSFKESLPIHLVEDPKYIYRDKFFLKLGYIVIRFAEYQIAKHPDYCCLHIARVLNQFLDRDTKIALPNSINIEPLTPQEWKVKTWTQRESQIMADNHIRDTYLEPVHAFVTRTITLPEAES